MGFLGPAHDESWSAGWHIILLIKAWMVGWKARRGGSLQGLQQTPGISIPDKYILNFCMVLLSSLQKNKIYEVYQTCTAPISTINMLRVHDCTFMCLQN